MSIRIALDKPQEFYTNLDVISGQIILGLTRVETIGNIVVKLEGDARTALKSPDIDGRLNKYDANNVVTESHKLLYRIQQVFPTQNALMNGPGGSSLFNAGQHAFPFSFKMPLNNICHDPKAMSSLIGVGGMMSPGQSGMLGLGGFRTMDGTRQLMLQHVKSTLPPSVTGFYGQAEIRYYIKVTIQRPGFFKENWRFQLNFKFLPLEPPRPPPSTQEAFAKRPFAFPPRTMAPSKRQNLFGISSISGIGKSKTKEKDGSSSETASVESEKQELPIVEVAARLPHPAILTCNQNIPLRIITTKIAAPSEQVYLVGLEVVLIGYTNVRVATLHHTEPSRWVVAAQQNLQIPLGTSEDAVGAEFELPNHLWAGFPLPNTVAPSFKTCNVERRYEVEVNVALSWGLPGAKGATAFPQLIRLPLKLSNVIVYSGIKPPPELIDATLAAAAAAANGKPKPPALPPRVGTFPIIQDSMAPPLPPGAGRPPQTHDPLYPPQLGPGNVPAQDDAPPSYDEAMADMASAPSAEDRPAYSGVTDTNAPSTIPGGDGASEKRGWH